jgi:hypothetical protein
MNLKGCMQLIEIHGRWAQQLHIMRLFDERMREEQERDKWMPEKMPQEFDIDKEDRGGSGETERVTEQKQLDSVKVECTVTPFLQDFLTRGS